MPEWVDARVRARSDAPDVSSASAFWPFPDLALLELDGWTDHVCAPLTKDKPVPAGEPHAWGFGRREEGVASPGSAASFRYVGVDGDGYLQLRAGDAPPGLSGAPLVCPQRRAVAGLMSVSRKPDDARGGWASPVAALDGGPAVPDELARLGREVLARNRDVCWRHRNAWQSVLPIPGAGSLADRPWDGADVDPDSAQHGESCALNRVGETLVATCQPDQALAHHTAALTLASQIGDRYEQARAHNGLAHTYQAAGDLDQARHHWQHALGGR